MTKPRTKPTQTAFSAHLRVLDARDGDKALRRLRSALKSLLRTHNVRCITIQPDHQETEEN